MSDSYEHQKDRKIRQINDIIRQKLSPIKDFMNMPDVQEIMIIRPNVVFIEKAGDMFQLDCELSKTAIEGAIQLLAKLNDKDVDARSRDAIVNARVEGFRIAAAIEPVSVFGPSISIRKHNPRIIPLNEYLESGSITQEGYDCLRELIESHKNILVVGGTSSGKTTLMNSMLSDIDPMEAIRTCEDTQELKVKNINWVALEANEQNGVTMRDLVKLCLRYRPDRVILGEVRGAEAYDLMQAANTGHGGLMATLHANSAGHGLTRFENLVMESGFVFTPLGLKRSICDAFQAVVYCCRKNGIRRIDEIIEIQGVNKEEEYIYKHLYKADEKLIKARMEDYSRKKQALEEIAAKQVAQSQASQNMQIDTPEYAV